MYCVVLCCTGSVWFWNTLLLWHLKQFVCFQSHTGSVSNREVSANLGPVGSNCNQFTLKVQLQEAEEQKTAKKRSAETKTKIQWTPAEKGAVKTSGKPANKPRKKEKQTDSKWGGCGYCGYAYGCPDDPLLDDDWYLCAHCANWFHDSCRTCSRPITLLSAIIA